MRGGIAAHTRDVGGIVYGDGLGVLVLGMVLLCVDLFVLFEVLGALEGFLADLRGMSGATRREETSTSQTWGLRGVCTGGDEEGLDGEGEMYL